MPIKNEEVDQNSQQQNDNQQQDNNNQQHDDSRTGREDLDAIIDRTIEQTNGPRNTNVNREAADGKDKDKNNQQQQNRQQQQDDNTQRRGQGDAENQNVRQTRTSERQYGTQFRANAQGHIVDHTGAIVAHQGSQRAVFHKLWPMIDAATRERDAFRTRIETYENANKLAKEAGLALDEQGAALQLFVAWKKDPVKTLNTLLTMAEQGGKDVTSIRQGGGLSVSDVRAAVQEIVAEQIKPFSGLLTDREAAARNQEIADEVETEYTAFIEQFPDARVHEESIANVMRDKQLNHREAYFAVRAFAAERGLDWTKPLAPQLAGNQQAQSPSGAGNNRQRQLPNMGGRGNVEGAHIKEGALKQADANESWDSIARRAFANAGIPV